MPYNEPQTEAGRRLKEQVLRWRAEQITDARQTICLLNQCFHALRQMHTETEIKQMPETWSAVQNRMTAEKRLRWLETSTPGEWIACMRKEGSNADG